MKLNYRHFTRPGANSKGATSVPEEFIRKPKVLKAIEAFQFFVSVGFLISLLSIKFGAIFIGCFLLGNSWLASSLLLATDNYKYLHLGFFSGLSSVFVAVIYLVLIGFNWWVVIGLGFGVLYLGLLVLPAKNKKYYKWAYSLAG